MKRLYIFLLIFFLSLIPVHAQSSYAEVIEQFRSEIQIKENGMIEVKETIVYDFGALEKHGIYRNLDTIKTNKDGKKYRMDIEVEEVSDEQGNKYQYKANKEEGLLKLRIGDPDKYVSGQQTYVISYKVSGALTYFSDHDELYWQITGTEWDVPIQQATTTITLPQALQDQAQLRVVCYTGYTDSASSNCSIKMEGNTFTISSSSILEPSQGMTAVISFPKGIASVLEPQEVVSFFDTFWGKVTLVIVGILAVLWYTIYPLWLPVKWFLYGRDPSTSSGQVQAWYDPPTTRKGRFLTPAETGTLIDEHAGPREISALIVDLARRGYFKIVEHKKHDYELVKTKEFAHDTELEQFERVFLTELFAVKDKVRIKDADLYDVVNTVHTMIYDDMVKEGYFPSNPDKTRKFYAGLAGAAAVTFNFLLLITASIFGRLMPHKTMDGVHAANRARSLKNFLTSQERQLEYQAQNQMFFEKLLPFAVAFGVEKVWAARFKNIKMTPPDWYQGTYYGAFNAGSFTNSLNRSLSSFNSAATPTTSSSGFSSGFSGGSVGGGGGGGGGGSW